jgi:MFS transporter, DHA1 family, multidrug resistance protein
VKVTMDRGRPAARLARGLADRVDRTVLPAAAVAVVVALGFGLIVPVLPIFARSFGVPAAQVGLLVSAFALVRLFCDVPAGRLVDRLGSGRAVAVGTAIVGISSAAVGLASSFTQLVVLRGLGGVGSALFSSGLMAYILTVVPPERMGRAMGLYQGAFLLGSAFGPTVGGLTADALGLRGPFFVYAGFCAAATAVALLVLRPPASRPGAGHAADGEPAEAASGLAAARRGRAFPGQHGATATSGTAPAPRLRPSRGLCAALGAGFALWWLLGGFRFALVPLYGQERLGLDSAAIGLGITASAITNVVTVWPGGWAADRWGRYVVGVPAFLGLAGAAGLFLLAQDFTGFLVANALFGAIYGVAGVIPGTLLADAIPRDRAGSASGLNYVANDLGSVIGPVAVGVVLDVAGYGSAIALSVAPAVLVAGAIVVARRPRPASSSSV